MLSRAEPVRVMEEASRLGSTVELLLRSHRRVWHPPISMGGGCLFVPFHLFFSSRTSPSLLGIDPPDRCVNGRDRQIARPGRCAMHQCMHHHVSSCSALVRRSSLGSFPRRLTCAVSATDAMEEADWQREERMRGRPAGENAGAFCLVA